ncbi:WD40-repeat-containing domain protein [Hyaloraphidium curvatum]|nr:WD40-repeat-containing domain protein [Hyaloraphidium curvatum]
MAAVGNPPWLAQSDSGRGGGGGGGGGPQQHFQRAGPSYVQTASGATVPPWQRGLANVSGGGGGGFQREPGQYNASTALAIYDEYRQSGKKQRKAIQRRTVDYYAPMMRWNEKKHVLREGERADLVTMQPDPNFVSDLLPPFVYKSQPITSVTAKFIHTSINKNRCPINACRWFPDGRRLITGAHSGEFTLWNGFTFNFENIQQAHDSAVRALTWTPSDNFLVSADDKGWIKYWQPSLTNVKVYQGHKEAIRGLSFSPSDAKFATCSDDGLLKVWDFVRATEERALSGHGWDVKCVDWNPSKALLASGSKDNLVKLWDPKSGKALATLHGHKNTILALAFNQNGNWLATASRDSLVRVFDIRTLKDFQNFRGHKKEVTTLKWHPFHERQVASGGSDGSLMFWEVEGGEAPIASVEGAHESQIWELDFHPMGHLMATASNDVTTRFWGRNRPGDGMPEIFLKGYERGKKTMVLAHEEGYEDDHEHRPPSLDNRNANPFASASAAATALPGFGGGAPSNPSPLPLPGLQGGPPPNRDRDLGPGRETGRDVGRGRDRDRRSPSPGRRPPTNRPNPNRGGRGSGRNVDPGSDSDRSRSRSPPRRLLRRDRSRSRSRSRSPPRRFARRDRSRSRSRDRRPPPPSGGGSVTAYPSAQPQAYPSGGAPQAYPGGAPQAYPSAGAPQAYGGAQAYPSQPLPAIPPELQNLTPQQVQALLASGADPAQVAALLQYQQMMQAQQGGQLYPR